MYWRSLLFVPADRPDFIARAATRGADAVILDLEDGVAEAAKPAARESLRQSLASLQLQGVRTVLRVNAQVNEMRQDLEAADLQSLAAVLVPKCESLQDLQRASMLMEDLGCTGPRAPGLLALIETPLGVLNAQHIAIAPKLFGLIFGSEDYAAAMGAPPEPALLAQPAGYVAMVACAHGLLPIGLVGSLANFSRPTAFSEIVQQSKAVGLKAAAVVHPSQVALVNTGFAPDEQEITHAERVVAAFESSLTKHAGALSIDGHMVDQPVYARAKALLATIDTTATKA